jgi:CheY-like chemotaxis protein/HPt (histidine-containing phosphotransfer) domain-containing protein
MPDMDGAALGEAIKQNEQIAGTHLILLSSLGERGDIHRFEKIGFTGFMVKPLRHTDLFNVLSIALAGNESNDPPRPILTRHSAREIRRISIGVNARILLVEDNATNQLVALALLKKFGLKTDAVADGAEAVKALETVPYNLVLMDVQMPIMDGYEATRQIRDIHSKVIDHNIPVIAMTANALQGDRERCLEAGMNDYISKPIVFKELSEVLERWLTGVPGAPKLTPKPKPVLAVETHDSTQNLVFDKAAFLARVMGDAELAQSIIKIFLKDIPIQIQILEDYLRDDNLAGAERQAHSIKGAAANIGGDMLKTAASEIEISGKRGGGKPAMLEQIPDLIAQFEQLKSVLEMGISNE